MKLFEDATRVVSLADIFSRNESFEEISTENINYLLLPALLGTLTIKLCNAKNNYRKAFYFFILLLIQNCI